MPCSPRFTRVATNAVSTVASELQPFASQGFGRRARHPEAAQTVARPDVTADLLVRLPKVFAVFPSYDAIVYFENWLRVAGEYGWFF